MQDAKIKASLCIAASVNGNVDLFLTVTLGHFHIQGIKAG